MILKSDLSDTTLDKVPFFRLLEDFLQLIEDHKGVIKLTQNGALPKAVLEELYGKGYILEDSIEKGRRTLSREIHSEVLTTLHIIAKEMGLIKKQFNRLSLTKKAEKLRGKRQELFKALIHFYAEQFNWGYHDLYPDEPVGQVAWPFTLYLLNHFKSIKQKSGSFGVMYMNAFPQLLEEFFDSPYSSAELSFVRCYCVRSFTRFLNWFGIVEFQYAIHIEEQPVVATSLLWELFEFDE